jgi:hypothetical protein
MLSLAGKALERSLAPQLALSFQTADNTSFELGCGGCIVKGTHEAG